MMQPTYLALIGAVIAAIGTLYAVVVNSQEARWLLAVVVFLGTLIGVIATFWADAQQDQKTEQLIAAQREALRLGRQLEDYTRGSGSYAYVEPTVSSSDHAAIGAVVGVGTNPLYDLRIRIVPDPERRGFPGVATYDVLKEVMRVEKWIDVGALNPTHDPAVGYPSLLVPLELGEREQRRGYNIFLSARNDTFVQLLRFVRVDDRWFVAYRVIRGADAKGPILREVIQSGYPRNAGGGVDWAWTWDRKSR